MPSLASDRWWEEGDCVTPKFKDLATRAGAYKPSEVFFPITQTDNGQPLIGQKVRKYQTRQLKFEQLARRTCGDCPVRRECLLDACQSGSEWGLSGGLTPKQRDDLLDGGDLVSHPCPCCDVTLWGTKKIQPPKTCGG